MSIIKIKINKYYSLFATAGFGFFTGSCAVSPSIADLRFLLLAIMEDELKLLNGRGSKCGILRWDCCEVKFS
jgi:hypothetical protein